MTTRAIYYEQPYAQGAEGRIVSVVPKGGKVLVELDQTVFYPEGGGQPSDQGEIIGPNGRLKVDFVQFKEDAVIHHGVLVGTLLPGDSVRQELKWGFRHHNMRVHSAGHLIHDVLMRLVDGLEPSKGSHGKKAFLEYKGTLDPSIKSDLESQVNEAIAADLPITTRESSYEEIVSLCRFVPPGLPKNKALRVLQIDTFVPMPDGGVQVKSTKEIGAVLIQDIQVADGSTTIKYRVSGGSEDQ